MVRGATGDDELLAAVERYYDAAPRAAARAEGFGPLTLFVNAGPGWPYYARPTPGATAFAAADVARVRERQRALGVPESVEWVAEATPGLRAAVEGAGLVVHEHPLLVLDRAARRRAPAPGGTEVRLAAPDDDLALLAAVAHVGFGAPGTAIGEAGTAALEGAADRTPEGAAFARERLRAGRTITAVARAGGAPVAVGSHQPVGGVSEVVGVATLPAFRRRGLAAAVVDLLLEDALRRGAAIVFLSAGDAAVARVYARLGFRPLATACIAEPPAPEHGPLPGQG